MKVTLYGIPGSHPVIAARLMLEHKGIEYRRVDFLPVLSRALVRALRFPGNRVPALKIDGRRVQGSREISRELERLRPDPPLFPADPARRRRVEEAERWGDGFQQAPRSMLWWAFKQDPSIQLSFVGDARLGVPPRLAVRLSGPVVWAGRRLNDSYDPTVAATLAGLPVQLDQIDRWIAEGVLNQGELNAADFQIATSVRSLTSFEDLAPAIEGRPAGELARRVVASPPGRVPPVFPREWLEPLRAPARR